MMRIILLALLILAGLKWPDIIDKITSKSSVEYFYKDSITGIDISRHQREIVWEDVRSSQIKFAFIKATEGKDYKDPNFNKNWDKSKKEGIIRGAYHYYRPNSPPDLQALNFISSVMLESGDLPPVLDIEEGIDKLTLKGDIFVYLKILENAYRVTPIIYCNSNYYNKLFEGDSLFAKYPKWIAHYGVSKPSVDKYHFWQKTDKGRVRGINSPVDLNEFRGTYEDLEKLLIN